MAHENLIVAVERMKNDSILINLRDGTAIYLTLDQLLGLGVTRIAIPPDDDSFEQSLRRALEN